MRVNTALSYILLTVLAVLFLLPVCVILTNSLMSGFEISNRFGAFVTPENFYSSVGAAHFAQISLIPDSVTLTQYFDLLFGSAEYIGKFWNSVLLAAPIVAGQIVVSAPAAYAFEMSRFKFKEIIYFIYIVIMLVPLQVSLVPNYIMAQLLTINGTRLAIILPGMASPFGVFLIRQHMKNLPRDYVEAAQIDGAGHLRVLILIVTPLFKPAVAALFMLSFIENWNLVEQPVIFLRDIAMEPLSVYLSQIDGSLIFAASCFYMLPAVLIFLYGQEYMVEGIQLSGIK
ncbi:MAG: carbohydrate ABC transporter permease [Clostridiales bacterium]|jgi:multiple sugar transport system permease protein|nr:carbohydrate ABC transporter permease [Clostridiales bacterium]